MNKRLLELFALLLVGDAVLTVVEPKRHCLLWAVGPEGWKNLMLKGAEHPEASRWIGVAQAAAGLWLASRQEPGPESWS